MVTLIILLFLASVATAQDVTLSSPKNLDVPVATKVRWKEVKILPIEKKVIIKYEWLDADNTPIRQAGTFRSEQIFTCADVQTPGENAECTASGDPNPCCTGVGSGTCDGMVSTCFSETFGFTIRPQDAGQKIGVGLRTLLWNKLKAGIVPGDTGTFTE